MCKSKTDRLDTYEHEAHELMRLQWVRARIRGHFSVQRLNICIFT